VISVFERGINKWDLELINPSNSKELTIHNLWVFSWTHTTACASSWNVSFVVSFHFHNTKNMTSSMFSGWSYLIVFHSLIVVPRWMASSYMTLGSNCTENRRSSLSLGCWRRASSVKPTRNIYHSVVSFIKQILPLLSSENFCLNLLKYNGQ